jgi:hypothetical protein
MKNKLHTRKLSIVADRKTMDVMIIITVLFRAVVRSFVVRLVGLFPH